MSTASGFSDYEKKRVNGINGWYIPLINGSFEWVDMDDDKDYVGNQPFRDNFFSTNPVTFYLYTNSKPNTEQIITASIKSIDASTFNPKNPTRISIHGWGSGKNSFVNFGVRDAWLSTGEYNFIFVDWGRARSVDYASSTYAVAGVGKKVALLVDFLVKNYGLNLDTLEIIGHSLGAHVAGFTGKNIKTGKVHTIVGLDPALPLFNYNKPKTRLCSTDANYVESIQTNGGKLGFLKPIGKGAFYPNGGKLQPGCKNDLSGSCSHSRSIVYYVEAVGMDNFTSVKCQNYADAASKNCGSTFSSVRMGAIINAYMVAGTFYVPVKNQAPYGMLA